MDSRISIITLGVKDLEKATRFYEEGLGLNRLAFEGEITFFSLRGTWLALYPKDGLAKDAFGDNAPQACQCGFAGMTLAHNVRSKEDVHAVLDEAVAAGATLVKPPQDVHWGGYSGYFADPDGHLWEVAWNPYWKFSQGDA